MLRDFLEALPRGAGWLDYKLTLTNKHRYVCIVMYHDIADEVRYPLQVTLSTFENQISQLSAIGDVVPLGDVNEDFLSTRSEPVFCVTFDDAFASFYSRAYPIMEKMKVPSTLYVPTQFVFEDGGSPMRNLDSTFKSMTPAQLEELVKQPYVSVGSHTHSHSDLRKMPASQIKEEFRISDSYLESIGMMTRSFAYPMGLYDKRVVELVEEYYSEALTVDSGLWSGSAIRKYEIPRVAMVERDLDQRLESKINHSFCYFDHYIKRMARAIKR